MAGHAAQDRLDPRLHQQALALAFQLVQNIADHGFGVDLAEDRRRFAHGNGVPTEGFDPEAEFGEVVRHAQDRCAVRRA